MTVRRRVGVLIAIEGVDGTGKSTLQRSLARRWRKAGWRVALYREPTRSRIGRHARHVSGRDAWTAALAFTEDRRQQRPRVERSLRRPMIVLLDRSYFSTLAYQGSALPAPLRRSLEHLQREAAVVPDRVLLLELPLSAARSRRRGRRRTSEPTERASTVRRAARAYREMARPPRWVRLDARLNPEALTEAADRAVSRWIRRRLYAPRRRA